MKKHFEQAIAFDRDNPLNQRVGLGKKYNELVDEYNALEAKLGAIPADEQTADDIDVQSDDEQEADEQEADETVSDGADPTEEQAVDASADKQATEEVESTEEEE